MHTRLCRLSRGRGRWRSYVNVVIYYMVAVVLVENVIIAWHSSFQFRPSVVRLSDETASDDVVDVSDPSLDRMLETPSLAKFNSASPLPMTTIAAAAVQPEVRADRFLISPMSDMNELERRFYRRQPSPVNNFRHSFRRVPPGLCRNETNLVVLVHSHPKYIDRRSAIRKTWGSAIRTGHWPRGRMNDIVPAPADLKFMRTCCNRMQIAFVVGLSRDPGLNDAVDEEFLTHWDVIQGDFIDDYQNMTLKSLIDLKFVAERCQKVRYLLKTDDDMIVNMPYLVDILDEIATTTNRFIVGPLNVGSKVYRNGKWKLTKKEFPFEYFPPYESGSAYVISADLVNELLNASRYVPSIFIDDVYITGILGKIIGVEHVRWDGFAFWTSRPPSACDLIARRIVTGTKMNPINLDVIWNELQRGIVCPPSLIFESTDPLHPYLENEKPTKTLITSNKQNTKSASPKVT